MRKTKISQRPDDIDLKAVCLDIIRDLYAASKSLQMYPLGHPLTDETLKKPLGRLNNIFRLKNSFAIQCLGDRLITEGLLLEDTVFVKGFLLYLRRHGLESVKFTADLTLGDLYHFLTKLLEPKSPTEDYFGRFLEKRKVRTIAVNVPCQATLYDFNDTVIGSPGVKYLLYDRLRELVFSRPAVLVSHYLGRIKDDDQVARELGVDLRLTFVAGYFSTAISDLPEETAIDIFKQLVYASNWLGETINEKDLQGLRRLWHDYARHNEDMPILMAVYRIFKSVGVTRQILEVVFDKGAMAKLKAVRDAEEIIDLLQSSRTWEIEFDNLRRTVFKLATQNNADVLKQLQRQLLSCFGDEQVDTRQRCLRLTIVAVDALVEGSFWEVFNQITRDVLQTALSPGSAEEIIPLIAHIAEKSAAHARWDELNICSQTLKNIVNKFSETKKELAKSHLSELGDSPIMIDILVDAVVLGKGGRQLYQALSSIASQKIAAILAAKIDSPNKVVRTRVIKALVGMGRVVGPVITEIFAGIVGAGQKEDDQSWYRLRNMLRVIGHIKYIEALPYFEILTGWRQRRIKLELISACEAMGSPATAAILSKLAIDPDYEVSKAAVVAMGMSGHPDMVKYLRSLLNENSTDKVLLVAALGRIGGNYARDILIDLYEDADTLKGMGISKKEEEKIRMTIVKSLSRIGDDISKSKAELYSQREAGKGGLFKKDLLTQTAKILLGEKQDI